MKDEGGIRIHDKNSARLFCSLEQRYDPIHIQCRKGGKYQGWCGLHQFKDAVFQLVLSQSAFFFTTKMSSFNDKNIDRLCLQMFEQITEHAGLAPMVAKIS